MTVPVCSFLIFAIGMMIIAIATVMLFREEEKDERSNDNR
jgi:hypothetical protein